MGKLEQYPSDSNISDNDKLLGTDSEDNNKTKNFSIGSLVRYLVSRGVGTTGPRGLTGATGQTGQPGDVGKSAYQIALLNGYVGNEAQWLSSLVGPPGESLPYKQYAVRLFQSGVNAPSVQKVFIDQISSSEVPITDPDYLDALILYVSVGIYKLMIRTKSGVPLNSFNCDLSFSDNKIRATGSSSGSNPSYDFTEFAFETRNAAGVLADGIIVFSNLYFKIWD